MLGASFITEGAIPFAAADPLRVIPAIMLGSAVTGIETGSAPSATYCTLNRLEARPPITNPGAMPGRSAIA